MSSYREKRKAIRPRKYSRSVAIQYTVCRYLLLRLLRLGQAHVCIMFFLLYTLRLFVLLGLSHTREVITHHIQTHMIFVCDHKASYIGANPIRSLLGHKYVRARVTIYKKVKDMTSELSRMVASVGLLLTFNNNNNNTNNEAHVR